MRRLTDKRFKLMDGSLDLLPQCDEKLANIVSSPLPANRAPSIQEDDLLIVHQARLHWLGIHGSEKFRVGHLIIIGEPAEVPHTVSADVVSFVSTIEAACRLAESRLGRSWEGADSAFVAADRLEDENRRLRKEVEDLLTVGEIARSITGTLLIEEILDAIMKGIQRVLSVDRVLLGLVNSEEDREEVKLSIGLSESRCQELRWKITEDDPIWRELGDSGRPIEVFPSRSHHVPGPLGSLFAGGFVKAPMIVRGEIVGTIMADRRSGDFAERELGLLGILVEYAGIAIENGRLYYDVIKSEEELKEAHRQLVEAERMAVIGQLAVSINHEINNPLCSIQLLSSVLKGKLLHRAPDLVGSVEKIDRNIERISRVTERITKLKESVSTEYLPDQLMIDLEQ